MPGHQFISFSASDAETFALKLADDLQAGPPPFPVWIFRRELRASASDWDAQLRDAIRDCDSLIFVMSCDSVTDESVCKLEWTAALKYKKPILLVRLHADAEAPFRIASRQYIDFADDYNVGLAKLRKDLQWLHLPEGELQTLKFRFADAERDLRRASDADRLRVQADIDLLRKQIADRTEALKNPKAAAEKTEKSIAAALERERAPEKPISGRTRTKFINPPPVTAPAYFQDRFEENKIVRNFLQDESKRLLTINGRAGIGKTAMVCRLLKALESGRLPDDLGEMSVDGIVYLSAIGVRQINTPNLFEDLCKLLPADTARELDALYRDPKIPTKQKMLALLERFPSGRIVVLLDNFETVVDATSCCITDTELDETLRAFLSAPHHAVKVILTTRVAPHELELVQPVYQAYLPLDKGLPTEDAKRLLREMDSAGIIGLKTADDKLLERAVERTRGFPRALEALYAILSADRYTTLEEILGPVETLHATSLPENVVEALVGQAYSRLDATAQQTMQALAAYARPVPPAAADYLLQPFIPNVNSAPVLNRLVNMQFAHRESGRYYLHPTDREYAFARVPRGEEKTSTAKSQRTQSKNILVSSRALRSSRLEDFSQKILLNRAADYFAQTRKPRETWKTLADLEPQLNEFDLRCAAEDYDTAASVLLEIDFDYLLLWGHYRLMTEMHGRVREKLQDQNLKSQSLNNLGLAFNSTGQTQKAIACYEEGLILDRAVGNKMWEGADLGNLGSAYSNLGETRRAITFYEQALAIAREIGDKSSEGALLGNLGNRYAELGETRRAITFYEQALAIAREIGDKGSEGHTLGLLGTAYNAFGQTARAIEFYQQALDIAREIGERSLEGSWLGNLGSAYSALGDTRRAIAFYEQALAIAREIGDKSSEGALLGNLGNRYAELGETRRAITFYEQALAIARETENRNGEGRSTHALAESLLDAGQYDEAKLTALESLKIGEEIGDPEYGSQCNKTIALAHLYSDNLPAARTAAEAARKYDVPENNHNVAALLGIIALRLCKGEAFVRSDSNTKSPSIAPNALSHQSPAANASPLRDAIEAFTAAIQHADVMLERSAQNFDALDAKGVALCGLALVGAHGKGVQLNAPTDAIATFRAARKINKDAGIVARLVRLLDALALAHPNGTELLAEARQAASEA